MIKFNANLQKEKQLNLAVEKGRGTTAMNRIFYVLSTDNFLPCHYFLVSARQMSCYHMRAVPVTVSL